MTVPFIFCASITAMSAIISLGFSIAAVLGLTGTARIRVLYACARSLALVIASAVPFLTGSTEWLQAIAWSTIIVQACDAVIGTTIKDRMKTFGPAGTALLNLTAVIWLIQAIPGSFRYWNPRDFRVVAVQLALTSLAEDIEITERALALETGPVLLVGHWYGGVVITEVGNNPKVTGLVYVAALAPDRNESAISLLDAFPPTHLFRDLTPDGHGFLKVTPRGVFDLAHDLSESQRNLLLTTQHPTAEAIFSGKVKNPAWRKKPSWFLIPSDDRAIGTDLQKREAEKANATALTVTSSHLVLVSHPDKVAAFIEQAVTSVAGKQ